MSGSKTPRADTMQRAANENFTDQESAVKYCHAVACNLETDRAALIEALEQLYALRTDILNASARSEYGSTARLLPAFTAARDALAKVRS